jgi:hypothetical protein
MSGAMRSAFLPPDATLLARQADLYRRLAQVARSPETAARLKTLAEACAADAAALRTKEKR